MLGRKRIFLVVTLAGAVLALSWLYGCSSDSPWRTGSGAVHRVSLDGLGITRARPQAYWHKGAPAQVIAISPSGNGVGPMGAVVVDLRDGTTASRTMTPSELATLTVLGSTSVRADCPPNERELPSPHCRAVATVSLHGWHVRLPYFQAFSFPEKRRAHWRWAHRYTGLLSLRLEDRRTGEVSAEVNREIRNWSVLPTPAELGFWTPDGRYFLAQQGSGTNHMLLILGYEPSKE